MKSWTLQGKKVLITGGTKGIGLAIAEEFASLGAEVFIVARNADDVKSVAARLTEKGHRVSGLAGDVSDGRFRKQLVEQITSTWDALDVLVHNVGTNIRKKFVDYTEEEYRKVFEVNLFTATEMSRLCFPL